MIYIINEQLIKISQNEIKRYKNKKCPGAWGLDCIAICDFERCWNARFIELIEEILA